MISFQDIIDRIVNLSIYFVIDNDAILDIIKKQEDLFKELGVEVDNEDLKIKLNFVFVNDIDVDKAKEFYFSGNMSNIKFENDKCMIPSFGSLSLEKFVGTLNHFVLKLISDKESDCYNFSFFDVLFFKYYFKKDEMTFFIPDNKHYNKKWDTLNKHLTNLKSITDVFFKVDNREQVIDNVININNMDYNIRVIRRMIMSNLIKCLENLRYFYDKNRTVDLSIVNIIYNIFINKMRLDNIFLDSYDDLGGNIKINLKDVILNYIIKDSIFFYSYINDSILSLNNIVNRYFYSIKVYGVETGFSYFYAYIKRLFNLSYVAKTIRQSCNLSKYGIDIHPEIKLSFSNNKKFNEEIKEKIVLFKIKYANLIESIKELLPNKRSIEKYYILRNYIYSIIKSYLKKYLFESGQQYQLVYVDDYNDLVSKYCLYSNKTLEDVNKLISVLNDSIDDGIFDFVDFLYFLPNLYYYKMLFEK
ncbi:MAG: hypothetical protein QXF12_00015 [Candidatus Aenigmatarchaeota archaeon]